jgi:hypothetical protein
MDSGLAVVCFLSVFLRYWDAILNYLGDFNFSLSATKHSSYNLVRGVQILTLVVVVSEFWGFPGPAIPVKGDAS